MSRQSPTVDIELEATKRITIGGQDVVLTCKSDDEPDKLPVKEIYVSKTSGKLVIVFDDGE